MATDPIPENDSPVPSVKVEGLEPGQMFDTPQFRPEGEVPSLIDYEAWGALSFAYDFTIPGASHGLQSK